MCFFVCICSQVRHECRRVKYMLYSTYTNIVLSSAGFFCCCADCFCCCCCWSRLLRAFPNTNRCPREHVMTVWPRCARFSTQTLRASCFVLCDKVSYTHMPEWTRLSLMWWAVLWVKTASQQALSNYILHKLDKYMLGFGRR